MGYFDKRRLRRDTEPIFIPARSVATPDERRRLNSSVVNALADAVCRSKFEGSESNPSTTRQGGLLGSVAQSAVDALVCAPTQALVNTGGPLTKENPVSCHAGLPTKRRFRPDWGVSVHGPQTTESHPGTPVFVITTPVSRSFDGKLENLDLYRTFRENLTISLTNAVALPQLDYPAPQDWLEPTLIPTGRTLADIAPALEAAARALQLPEPDERKNATFSSQLELTPFGTFPNFTGLEVSVWRTMTSRAGTVRLTCLWSLRTVKANLDGQPHVIVYSNTVGRVDGQWLGVDHRRQLVRTVLDAVGSKP